MLSLSRQCVNRALKTLESDGVITLSYKRIRINDLEKLGAFGQGGTSWSVLRLPPDRASASPFSALSRGAMRTPASLRSDR